MINDFEYEIKKILSSFGKHEAYSQKFIRKINQFSHVCVWGTGEQGQKFVDIVKPYIKVDFYCDNDKNKWGKYIKGVRCIAPEELDKYEKNEIIIILTTGHYISIKEQLEKCGYKHLKVILNLLAFRNNLKYAMNPDKLADLRIKFSELINICNDYKSKVVALNLISNWLSEKNPDSISYRNLCVGEQYFDNELINLNEKEVFVDAGAWDGDTIFSFLRNKKNNFKNIHAFELDFKNYINLKDNIELLDEKVKNKIKLYNIGIWDKKDTVFYNELNTGSIIDSTSTGIIGNVDSLDNLLGDTDITFLKMDIEGAEMNAINGAKKIIQNKKPKLAICIYHSSDDLWQIPLFLKNLVPEYKIFIRHYGMDEYETVCYAFL